MDDELSDGQGTSKAVNSVESSCEKLRNSINRSVSETVIVIRSDEEGGASVSGENGDRNRNGNSNASKDDMHSCTIGVKSVGGNEDLGGERVCRICHLSSDPSSSSSKTPTRTSSRTTTETTATDIATTSAVTDGLNLIELGCGCKDELGIVHAHCAEAWFKLKGDRQCEICGEMAKNVTGIGDNKFMEKWKEMRSIVTGIGGGGGGDANLSSRGGGGIGRFCSFMLVCLTIAFTWSWFFCNNRGL